MKTIAIDFDGVIHRYSGGWADGSCYDIPVDGAFTAIAKLQKHFAVFILSTRDPQQIHEWFERMNKHAFDLRLPIIETVIVPPDTKFWSGPKVGITNHKLAAIAYIDDRGLRFTNWTDILNYFA